MTNWDWRVTVAMDAMTSIRDCLLPSASDTEEARRAKELVRRLMDAKPEGR